MKLKVKIQQNFIQKIILSGVFGGIAWKSQSENCAHEINRMC